MYVFYYLNVYHYHVSTASEFLPANICSTCLLNEVGLIKPQERTLHRLWVLLATCSYNS